MTAHAHANAAIASRPSTVALTLAGAAVVAVGANSVVALTAISAGASTAFLPLTVAVYGPLTVVGLVAGFAGWYIIRARSTRSVAILRVLVPALLVASFIPDTVTAIVGFIPDGSLTGYVALMLMHPIVVAVGVPVFQRLAPVRHERRA
jgi:hypothetical protein